MASVRIYNIKGGRVKECVFGFIRQKIKKEKRKKEKKKDKKEKGIKITNSVAYFYLLYFLRFILRFKFRRRFIQCLPNHFAPHLV